MDVEGRVQLIREMRAAKYWRDKHDKRLDELVKKALEEAGFGVPRIAKILGVSQDTVRRHYVYPNRNAGA